jgi:homoserine kinase
MFPSRVTVTVPATTANLGAGFDCIGAALSLHNQFQFSRLPDAANPDAVNDAVNTVASPKNRSDRTLVIQATGVESERIVADESNLAYQAFLKLYQQIDQPPPPIHLAIELGIPLARGLGSSATAIVGGLVGANALAGSPLSPAEVMQLAIAMEGHPDNVVPAMIGGCQLAAMNPEAVTLGSDRSHPTWTICDVPWHETIVPVIAIPNFELSTTEARRVLPSSYSRADAIFNIAHLGLLLRGLATGRSDWLRTALHDRIHQPYRQTLIRAYPAVHAAALKAGAYGLVISGAGSTLLALTSEREAIAVEAAMAAAWMEENISVETRVLQIDSEGAVIKESV